MHAGIAASAPPSRSLDGDIQCAAARQLQRMLARFMKTELAMRLRIWRSCSLDSVQSLKNAQLFELLLDGSVSSFTSESCDALVTDAAFILDVSPPQLQCVHHRGENSRARTPEGHRARSPNKHDRPITPLQARAPAQGSQIAMEMMYQPGYNGKLVTEADIQQLKNLTLCSYRCIAVNTYFGLQAEISSLRSLLSDLQR